MIVVSDSSPITALLKVNAVDLLKDLFADVVIPEAVAAELLQKHPSLPTWLRIVTVLDHETVLSRLPRIDLGEAEAIQLARELKATLLLIDDEEGRAVASEEGITFIDLLGVVLLARRRALIPSARSLVKSLQTQGGVYLSEKLIESALSTVGE